MSEADIEKKVKEAEQYAEEDKKRKEEIEIRNNADSLVYQTEKTLKDLRWQNFSRRKISSTSCC